jgi:hypothetical protein
MRGPVSRNVIDNFVDSDRPAGEVAGGRARVDRGRREQTWKLLKLFVAYASLPPHRLLALDWRVSEERKDVRAHERCGPIDMPLA